MEGWQKKTNGLQKSFKFKDFKTAWAFMTAVAEVAEELNHHPDWSNSYNQVHIRITSHDTGGVTAKDRQLARRINELAARFE